jgi:hypothetical protein
MILYHNAYDEVSGKVIGIDNVTAENRRSMRFFCIGCGTEMEAVLGQKREHHFRHKEVGDCNPETYLHRLAKRVLKYKFENQPQFPVQYFVLNECPKYDECEFRKRNLWHDCKTTSYAIKTLDLKQYYDTCEEEVWHNGFRADLMLTNSEHPEYKPVFLEVSVTHDCTPEKIDSKIRIIEVKIQSEKDAYREVIENEGECVPPYWWKSSNRYNYTPPTPIRFFNFKRDNLPEHQFSRFYLIRAENGILYAGIKPRAYTCHNAGVEHKEGVCFELTMADDKIQKQQYGRLYCLGIALAHKRGLGLKHCFLCSNYRNCSFVDPQPIQNPRPNGPTVFQKRVYVHTLNINQLEEMQLAYRCAKYKADDYKVQREINQFHNTPYWEWVPESEIVSVDSME